MSEILCNASLSYEYEKDALNIIVDLRKLEDGVVVASDYRESLINYKEIWPHISKWHDTIES